MLKGNVNVLDLQSKGECSLAEKGGEIFLKAGDPVSAMQAVARQARLQVNLTPVEVDRLMAAGRFNISLHYANKPSAATEAVKRIDRLVSDAVLASHKGVRKKRSVLMTLGLLLLAVVIGVVMFVVTVAVLDGVYGSHILSQFLR